MLILESTIAKFSDQSDHSPSRLQRCKYIEPDGRIGSKYNHVDRGSKQNGTFSEGIQAQRICDKERRKRHVFYCQINESK
jgi:hypothetical protein